MLLAQETVKNGISQGQAIWFAVLAVVGALAGSVIPAVIDAWRVRKAANQERLRGDLGKLREALMTAQESGVAVLTVQPGVRAAQAKFKVDLAAVQLAQGQVRDDPVRVAAEKWREKAATHFLANPSDDRGERDLWASLADKLGEAYRKV